VAGEWGITALDKRQRERGGEGDKGDRDDKKENGGGEEGGGGFEVSSRLEGDLKEKP